MHKAFTVAWALNCLEVHVVQDVEVALFLPIQAITGLNGMQLGEKKLIVQRASVGAKTNMNNVSNNVLQFLAEFSLVLMELYSVSVKQAPYSHTNHSYESE